MAADSVERSPLTTPGILVMAMAFMLFVLSGFILPAYVQVYANAAETFIKEPEIDTPFIWKEDFALKGTSKDSKLPSDWQFQRKPGTPPAEFSIVPDDVTGNRYLKMSAEKASSALICLVKGIDLEKTPILRWRWKVDVLPDGADGRVKSKDDQPIGIYVGTGNILKKRSISYRWDTETPTGSIGESSYAGGTVRVKWYTLRDKNDTVPGKWVVDERNVAEDFKNAWGFCPEKIFLSVSCNSQYTGTFAEAGLDWIEFLPLSSEGGTE